LSFGGGGSGGAALPLPHTHNSSIVNDGGDLSTTSPTKITNMPIQAFALVYG